ncbi:4Fe-4S cluster-binding domain-containing protein [Clostridium sporogenes]|uniref:4Fe-4S cluster-binding domain-containing protein n=1 Tax=Clostridium sporogenes TaxID=1509 RepID=UPI002238BB89|nr:4Fe-4S cluster-binding domain-containing protein [Clostridium sporogenes]MCW6094594.1 4Fe-4S cluster-binding domain-containing protein [Clostridium sporogenes]
MMKFLDKTITTYTDIKGLRALMFFSLSGCNLHCYKCHAYKDLVQTKHTEYYTEVDVLRKVEQSEGIVDAVIFSGGEFLISNIEDIKSLLTEVRKVFSGKIIVNTNGTFPHKMVKILDLVDGFHLDVKTPFWVLDTKEDKELFKVVYGVEVDISFINTLIKSLIVLNIHRKQYNLTRTVKYPFLPDEYFTEIKEFMQELELPYNLNEFVDLAES